MGLSRWRSRCPTLNGSVGWRQPGFGGPGSAVPPPLASGWLRWMRFGALPGSVAPAAAPAVSVVAVPPAPAVSAAAVPAAVSAAPAPVPAVSGAPAPGPAVSAAAPSGSIMMPRRPVSLASPDGIRSRRLQGPMSRYRLPRRSVSWMSAPAPSPAPPPHRSRRRLDGRLPLPHTPPM
jgi:hypothetical protein